MRTASKLKIYVTNYNMAALIYAKVYQANLCQNPQLNIH